MGEDFVKEFFAKFDLSEEAMLKHHQELFELSQQNPENMSYWFPKIENSTTANKSILKLPKTKIIPISFEWWRWLRTDKYAEEKIAEFSAWLNEQIGEFESGKRFFIKSGIFSNKFDFAKTIVEDRNNIGRQFLDIYYASLILGADYTAELVCREFIESKEERADIYNGMKLHTEYRVFYDFDNKKVVGVVNYWHPEVMEETLIGTDSVLYKQEKDKISEDYNLHKDFVIQEVTKYMEGVSGLTGEWSVDVMKNKDEFWLIDMARMYRSALVEQMETVN